MDIRMIVDAIDRLATARAKETQVEDDIDRALIQIEIERARTELAECFFESRPS